MDIITNSLFPIIIACIVGLIVYGYMYWSRTDTTDTTDTPDDKKPVNIFLPLMVSIVTWFLATTFVKYRVDAMQVPTASLDKPKPVIGPSMAGGGDLLMHNTVDLNSIMNAGKETVINIHRKRYTLPPLDVFTDIAKF